MRLDVLAVKALVALHKESFNKRDYGSIIPKAISMEEAFVGAITKALKAPTPKKLVPVRTQLNEYICLLRKKGFHNLTPPLERIHVMLSDYIARGINNEVD